MELVLGPETGQFSPLELGDLLSFCVGLRHGLTMHLLEFGFEIQCL